MTPRARALTPALLAVALLATLATSGAAAADTLTGWVYAPDGQRQVVLYRWALEREPAGHRWRSWYWTPQGELAAEDEVVWDGPSFVAYRYSRQPPGETATVERRGDVLAYRQVVRGVVRENREPFEDRVTVGPTVIPWIQQRWQLFTGERPVAIRYAVADQLRSFEFRLARVMGHPSARPGLTVIKMWPASPLLRLFVSPVYLVFSDDGSTFHSLVGRLLPVRIEHGRARGIDGELIPDSAVRLAPVRAEQGPGS